MRRRDGSIIRTRLLGRRYRTLTILVQVLGGRRDKVTVTELLLLLVHHVVVCAGPCCKVGLALLKPLMKHLVTPCSVRVEWRGVECRRGKCGSRPGLLRDACAVDVLLVGIGWEVRGVMRWVWLLIRRRGDDRCGSLIGCRG